MIDFNEIGPRIIIAFGSSGKVFLNESTCYEILIAIAIAALGIWMGSNLKPVPKGKQVVAEIFVGWIYSFTKENMGEEYEKHFAPFLGTLIWYLLFCNCIGLIGLRPVTADINVTSGMAAIAFIMVQYNAVHKLGLKGRLDEMCDPFGMMLPMKIISDVTLPVTLSLRNFGNIFGGMIVVELWLDFMGQLSYNFCPIPVLRAVTGIPLNLFFDMFEPVIQAYIFTILTAVNLKEGMEGMSADTAERRRLKRERRQEKKAAKLQNNGNNEIEEAV